MINKKKSTKKNDTSNSMVIKVMLLGFLGGNMIYAVIAFLMGDMQYIPEVLIKTGVCLVIHTILLLGVTAWNTLRTETGGLRIVLEPILAVNIKRSNAVLLTI